jgi:hypothetical protein
MKHNEVTVTEYSEHTEDPATWRSPRPDFDLDKFNRELVRRCGMIGDNPRFRLVWGGERQEYLIEEIEEHVGYDYRHDGKDYYVSRADETFEFPEGAVITPRYKAHEVFTPRWIIEEFRTFGPFPNFYHKAWAVEEVEVIGKQAGRVDLLSFYRQPSEVDMQMCENLARKRDTLTDADIKAGVHHVQLMEEMEKTNNRAEFVNDIAEETAKALTDGLPNAKRFAFNHKLQFDIRKHSENLIKEHDSKL